MYKRQVYAITKEVFENLDEFKKLHPALEGLTRETMLEGLTAPIHPCLLYTSQVRDGHERVASVRKQPHHIKLREHAHRDGDAVDDPEGDLRLVAEEIDGAALAVDVYKRQESYIDGIGTFNRRQA